MSRDAGTRDFFWGEPGAFPGLRAAFVERVPGVAGSLDKDEALRALEPAHRAAVERLGFRWEDLRRAEQVHGAGVAVVGREGDNGMTGGVDALVTGEAGVLLGIYVADCGAVYFHDRRTGALGLAHSGRKGTELGISLRVIETMGREFGTRAGDLAVGLAPCIRPPLYEEDFAAGIRRQVLGAGVAPENFTDSGLCTGADLERFCSYRMEKGRTGRMLALLGQGKRAIDSCHVVFAKLGTQDA